jgi:20S proteasome alpha/beta subunit
MQKPPFTKPYHRFRKTNRSRDLTYIFGARCKDGVVMVADRKIKNEDGSYDFRQAKLFFGPHPVVWGAAGSTGLAKSFINRVDIEVANLESQRQRERPHAMVTVEDFRRIVEDVYVSMVNLHQDSIDNLELLFAHSVNPKAELWRMNEFRVLENEYGYYGIGTGENMASFITKRDFFRPEELTMKEAAEVGYYRIKYIENYGLDRKVGVDGYLPQVCFLPDEGAVENEPWPDKRRIQLTDQELAEMESKTRRRLEILGKSVNGFWDVSA